VKILAIDTATNSCSVALADNFSLLGEITLVTAETHSKHLLKMIDQVLDLAGLTSAQVDGFAVTRGPGSFTGLRIGLSVVKGLAVASGKPVVAVSSLEALAFRFPLTPLLICTMIDARKKEVYAGGYRFRAEHGGDDIPVREIEEQVLPPAKLLEVINEPCLFVGSGAMAYRDMICDRLGELAFFAPPAMHCISAAAVAHLSRRHFQNCHDDDVAALKPQYIRQSDAELKFGKHFLND